MRNFVCLLAILTGLVFITPAEAGWKDVLNKAKNVVKENVDPETRNVIDGAEAIMNEAEKTQPETNKSSTAKAATTKETAQAVEPSAGAGGVVVKVPKNQMKEAAFYDQHINKAALAPKAEAFAAYCEQTNEKMKGHLVRDCSCAKSIYPDLHRLNALSRIRPVVNGTCDKDVVHSSLQPACNGLKNDPTTYLVNLEMTDNVASVNMKGYCDVVGGIEDDVIAKCMQTKAGKIPDEAKRDAYCSCYGREHTNAQRTLKDNDPSAPLSGSKKSVSFNKAAILACKSFE